MKWPSTQIRAICERTLTRDPREHPNEVFTYVDIASIDRDQKTITQVSNFGTICCDDLRPITKF